jgi:hypothetical protein
MKNTQFDFYAQTKELLISLKKKINFCPITWRLFLPNLAEPPQIFYGNLEKTAYREIEPRKFLLELSVTNVISFQNGKEPETITRYQNKPIGQNGILLKISEKCAWSIFAVDRKKFEISCPDINFWQIDKKIFPATFFSASIYP